jgi:hypothetical protein
MSSTKGAASNNMTDSLESILSYLKKIPSLKVDWLIDPQKTAVIVIDMINGFTREGTLQSPRATALIPTITKLIKHAHEYGIAVVAFADCHPDDSVECSDCWAKFYCSGGCHANAHLFNDTIYKPYRIGCALMKKRLECALYLKVQEAGGNE